ncbi:heat shock 70 kDa protein 12B-like [Mercenaria mercenaria]|uniref:heat shock 70 kDa protein 12B-like n=1 Tax=Mercenaria mercenaria TaxID=6596 RepID=UPI00234F0134|nr:heat shock 70 kDa protein 12B-like [Mercenaria mercenaria]
MERQTATSNRLLVAAIDFGTTYSGWAFSFKHEFDRDPTKATTKNWSPGVGTLVTDKTPTCILINPDHTFSAFGYDAENRYIHLLADRQHRTHYFFRNFKMTLFKKLGQKLDRNMLLTDLNGKELLAMDVFAMAIKYLANDVLQQANRGISGILVPSEIHWVLTVPAIWSDAAKQFMKEAWSKAGLPTERLMVALEPEVASLYCLHLPIDKTTDGSDVFISQFKTGTQYLVLDAGGGTIDITVHEVHEHNTLREVRAANGGDWGGIMVDKSFEDFLINLFGVRVMECFKSTETDDWFDLLREFESGKRRMSSDTHGRICMRLPVSLNDLYREVWKRSIQSRIASSMYAGQVEIIKDKIRVSTDIFVNLFNGSVRHIVAHLKEMMKDEKLTKVNVVLMVGGYSESHVLQNSIKEAFPNFQVIIPLSAASVVLRGALIFGHTPMAITERVVKYTYGVDYSTTFKEGLHQEYRRRRYGDSKTDYCYNAFKKYVEHGQVVKTGETHKKIVFYTTHKNQNKICFNIFASHLKDPLYVDDSGCFRIGKVTIEFAEPDDKPQRPVSCSMFFGGTEIIVEAEDGKTGRREISQLQMLIFLVNEHIR